ncbi:MAG: GH116 family glycosyl hydrolase [Bryobacteraceae bacterium]
MIRLRALSFLCALATAPAADLELSRPARHWEFMDTVGPRAAMLGTEAGTFEAWTFPLKILRDFRLVFTIDGRPMPAEALVRRTVSRPGSFSLLYSGDEFRVTETFTVPIDQPGILIRLQVDTRVPLRIDAHFTRDFQLMWPAAIGAPYLDWRDDVHGFVLGADGQPYVALVASPDAARLDQEYGTNFSASTDSAFTLGEVRGQVDRYIVIAASFHSAEELAATYRILTAAPARIFAETGKFYADYLNRTVQVSLPDRELQEGYDWSRLSEVKALVHNPLLGEGLAAGFGLSRGGNRPGFAWFFGRDSFWTSLAFTASGDLATARDAIRFVAKYQRADGKMPHEISQSASLIPWFEKYPYPYASADATPLFVIAVRDYVESSGDLPFLKDNWERLNKALSFMRSTLDPDGFPRNEGVGHGWVEGGPLLPIRTEFYQAGLYVEALRSMSALAARSGDATLAAQLDREFQAKRQALDRLFWIDSSKSWAFAIGQDGKPVDQPSVLATVPMWFGLPDAVRSREMIRQLADEPHATDWGMRIISSHSTLYSPAGYHFGSVWPLFTGWASVGEYRYHAADAGFANLKRNAWLALDGAGGNTTEVLSGDVYSPLSTASSHQTWSAAMIVSPLLRGLFGLSVNSLDRRIVLAPHLPASWVHFEIRNVALTGGTVDFTYSRDDREATLRVRNRGSQAFELDYAPAFAPVTDMLSAESKAGAPAALKWRREDDVSDWHARFTQSIPPGESVLVLHYRDSFGYSMPVPPPRLAEPSHAARIVSEDWENPLQLHLVVSGTPGSSEQIDLFGNAKVVAAEGGQLAADHRSIRFDIPGQGSDFVHHAVRLRLAR